MITGASALAAYAALPRRAIADNSRLLTHHAAAAAPTQVMTWDQAGAVAAGITSGIAAFSTTHVANDTITKISGSQGPTVIGLSSIDVTKKLYWEVKLLTNAGGSGGFMLLGLATQANTSYIGNYGSGNVGIAHSSDGGRYRGGTDRPPETLSDSGPTLLTGDSFCFACDGSNSGKLHWRMNNSSMWYGIGADGVTDNPVTGIGGWNGGAAYGGTMFPAISLFDVGDSACIVAGSNLSYPIPTGYTAVA